MSQYYPPQGPMYPPPPPQNPESNYYDEGDYEYEEYEDSAASPLKNPWVAFIGGGCLVFLCMSFCVLSVAALWFADSALGLSSPTPAPGSDIGLSFDEPAFPNESVVSDGGLQLTILEVNRNASVETVAPVEGRETIIVTVELVNLGTEESAFNERDFKLLNPYEEAYTPAVGAIAGALGRGTLPPNEGLEGRLVFETVAGETDLRLLWESDRGGAPRYLYLE